MRTEQVMTMILDLLMVMDLFGLKKSMPRRYSGSSFSPASGCLRCDSPMTAGGPVISPIRFPRWGDGAPMTVDELLAEAAHLPLRDARDWIACNMK